MSVSRPACVSAKPTVGSLAWIPISAADGNVMDIEAPVGSIIDLHVSHVFQDTGTAGTSFAVAAGTLGALYYLPLDGASDVFLPVGLTTTT
jgi:hypothetical protein